MDALQKFRAIIGGAVGRQMTDLLFYNGNILTQDSRQPQAEAVAIQNGRIQAVGTWDDIQNLAQAHTRRIDLGGRTVIPAFNDAHVHVWKVGHLLTTMLDVRGIGSIPALQQAIGDFSAQLSPQQWFMGRGTWSTAMAIRIPKHWPYRR